MRLGQFTDQLGTSSRAYRVLITIAIILIIMLLLIQHQYYREQHVPVTDTIEMPVLDMDK